MKKLILTLFVFLLTVLLSYFIIINTQSLSNGTALIIKDDFILSFIAIFAGLAIAIITFLYSNSLRFLELLGRSELDNKSCIKNKYNEILKELKQDTILIFAVLLLCFLLILFRDIDTSYLHINLSFLTKQQVISILQLSCILLTFASIMDIMGTLFKLIKIYALIHKEKPQL